MVKIETKDIERVTKDLSRFSKQISKDTQRGLEEIGRIVETEAKKRTPVSPTKSQADSDARYNYKRGRAPGTLQNSINLIKGKGFVVVGVLHGAALKYASFIHNGQGKPGGWKNIGPGSRAKGSTVVVGGKFIDRAYEENEDDLNEIMDVSVTKAVDDFNR